MIINKDLKFNDLYSVFNKKCPHCNNFLQPVVFGLKFHFDHKSKRWRYKKPKTHMNIPKHLEEDEYIEFNSFDTINTIWQKIVDFHALGPAKLFFTEFISLSCKRDDHHFRFETFFKETDVSIFFEKNDFWITWTDKFGELTTYIYATFDPKNVVLMNYRAAERLLKLEANSLELATPLINDLIKNLNTYILFT